MPEDYFADASPTESAAPSGSDMAEDAGDADAVEIPKTLLGGKKFDVGDELVLEIVGIREDTVLVKYASSDQEESKPPEAEPSEPGTVETESPAGGGGGGGGGNPYMY